ncbi:MAG TPA: DUF445 domain-containing protein [Stellaceae bacterium]|nr:DUF445 domain-containing protein [Stellaceae bacterium]
MRRATETTPERRRLRRARALATGLLALAAAVFAATLAFPEPARWAPIGWPLLRAVAEAALVGGFADWFAVTALFRRPLGLPIPHTAILPANKERIGEGLARFLDRHFLTPEVLIPEIRSLNLSERIALWLARRDNAGRIANEIARALPPFLHAVDDRQIRAFLGRALGGQLRGASLMPLLGQLIRALTATGYHEAVLDAALDYAGGFLARNHEQLLEAVAERRRRWIPRAVNRQIARAMLRAGRELIDDLRRPDGTARQALLVRIDGFAGELTDAAAPAAFGASPRAVLNRPEVRAWIAGSWDKLRGAVERDLEATDGTGRRALTLMIASLGESLKSDPAMRERLDAAFEALAIEALPWRAELVRFVSEVVRRWEPRGFSDRIEMAVGADLQFIRINGTIVGGLVGGVLYLLSLLAG